MGLYRSVLTIMIAFSYVSATLAEEPHSLQELEVALQRDLELIDYDPSPWTHPAQREYAYDVVFVGGGMAGMCATFALMKLGISNVMIFDEHSEGQEGCWPNYARMRELRSQKIDMGPALDVPHLTFRAWFEAQYGKTQWDVMTRAPTNMWMDYLRWYRKVLRLPFQNNTRLLRITPDDDLIRLVFETDGVQHDVWTRKVVLATGRPGFGGLETPAFVVGLPKHLWAHTGECIDFSKLVGRKVCVVGAGASAFDAAAVALEQGAQHVDMIVRRAEIPTQNKWVEMTTPGMLHGFFFLDDPAHWTVMCGAYQTGTPPPLDSINRVSGFKNFMIRKSTHIQQVTSEAAGVTVLTNHGSIHYDYMILATGFAIDGSKVESLGDFYDKILLWGDRDVPCLTHVGYKLKRAPYLGHHFQFREKVEGTAPYLKNIHCFNYAATFSHGMICGDIYGISIGANRLAQGIASDLFSNDLAPCIEEMR